MARGGLTKPIEPPLNEGILLPLIDRHDRPCERPLGYGVREGLACTFVRFHCSRYMMEALRDEHGDHEPRFEPTIDARLLEIAVP